MTRPGRRPTRARLADLGIADIDTGVVTLAGGQRHVAVLRAEGPSLHLLGEAEQRAVIGMFARLLDGQREPLQLVARTVPVDLGPRLARFRAKVPPELGRLGDAYVQHLRRVERDHPFLAHEYYVVLPGPARRSRQSKQAWRDEARRALEVRCAGLIHDLKPHVLATRLGSKQLTVLLYRWWSAEFAQHQRLDETLDAWHPLVVGAAGHQAESGRGAPDHAATPEVVGTVVANGKVEVPR